MDIQDSSWFPTTSEQAEELYRSQIVGRYSSNWNLISAAAGASLGVGLGQASTLLNAWIGTRDHQRAGEVRIAAFFNYRSSVVGPLLGAVIMAAMSLEAFARLIREVALAMDDVERERRDEVLKKFDRRKASRRIEEALESAGAEALPKDLRSDLQGLIRFRNTCAHDAPQLHLDSGTSSEHRLGKSRIVDQSNPSGLYPNLGGHLLPVSPAHAVHAIQVHDAVVNHLKTTAIDRFMQALPKVQLGHLLPILTAVPVPLKTYARAIHDWDQKFLPWFDSASVEEREAAYRDLIRGAYVKPVE